MDKGKAIFKMVRMNKWTVHEICKIVDTTPEECASLYKKHCGSELPPSLFVVGHDEEIKMIENAIMRNKHVLLHGKPGVGKTSSARLAITRSGRIMRMVNISDKRTSSLLSEVLYGSHLTSSRNVYLFDEVDNFDWRSHAYFLKTLKEAKVSIIMTCNNLSGISKGTLKWIKKNCEVIPMKPPSKRDAQEFLDTKFPNHHDDLEELYDPDFRVFIRNILYGKCESGKEKEKIDLSRLLGALVMEKKWAKRIGAVESCDDPLMWAITWLDYNAPFITRSSGMLVDFLDKVSRIDRWIIRTSPVYTGKMFAALPVPGRKTKLRFPAAVFAAEKRVTKKKTDNVEKTKALKIEKKPRSNTFDPMDW